MLFSHPPFFWILVSCFNSTKQITNNTSNLCIVIVIVGVIVVILMLCVALAHLLSLLFNKLLTFRLHTFMPYTILNQAFQRHFDPQKTIYTISTCKPSLLLLPLSRYPSPMMVFVFTFLLFIRPFSHITTSFQLVKISEQKRFKFQSLKFPPWTRFVGMKA